MCPSVAARPRPRRPANHRFRRGLGPPRAAWDDRVDPRVFRGDLREHLLESWRSEAWLFGAARMTRRIVGLAKTADIETLPEELRAGGARGVLQTARR